MDFPLYFQKRISPGHHFKIELEGWNFQDLLIFMQTITGSFCGMIGFFLISTPLYLRFFFQCSKPSCLALLSPKTNFVLIKKSQFHTNHDICDHIDLKSLTLFLETGYVCLSHFLGKFHQKHNQSLFQTLPKCVSRHTWLPN